MTLDLSHFTTTSARPLPVIILADISGSMDNQGKIQVLNRAVSEMIRDFTQEDNPRVEIHVAIITFGGENATLHQDLKPASEYKWNDFHARGRTPMGAAFRLATELIEDKEKIPSRAYAPAIILVSDGIPTDLPDEWEQAIIALQSSERASKAERFALAIGDDADIQKLEAFLNYPNAKVFRAHEASEIQKFFRYVTMSIAGRSRSNNPNKIQSTEPDEFDY